MSKQIHYYDRLTMALDDLLMCKEYCKIMLKLPLGEALSEERTVYEALFVAFVVSYGRVFKFSNTVYPAHKKEVNENFRKFIKNMINKQKKKLQKLSERILEKRDTAIAHSDAGSRNYQHYNNSTPYISYNPYYPYDYKEVSLALKLTENLIGDIVNEQNRVG